MEATLARYASSWHGCCVKSAATSLRSPARGLAMTNQQLHKDSTTHFEHEKALRACLPEFGAAGVVVVIGAAADEAVGPLRV